MTPSEAHFFIYARDRILYEERKHDYELMRKQTWYLLQPYGAKDKPIPQPEKLMPFFWDKNPAAEIAPEELAPEAWEQLDKRYGSAPFITEKK